MIGSSTVRWLLGLDAVPADAVDVRFAWTTPLPAWAWVIVVAAAVALAWTTYRRMASSAMRTRAFVALRSAVLVVLAALACGPVLEVPRERVEPDAVLMLVDRSRSLEVEDMEAPGGGWQARDAVLRMLVGPAGALRVTGKEHRAMWFAFSEQLGQLVPAGDGSVDPGNASGPRTLLARAIDEALSRGAGRPISSIVLVTDGRTTDPPDRGLVRRLQSEGVAVSSVALGSARALGDASIAAAEAPRRAFVRDIVPVQATIERRGPMRSRSVRVELVDVTTGTVLDRTEVAAADAEGDDATRDDVQLVSVPQGTGVAAWEVRVVDPASTRDLVPANDRRAVPVTLVDRPLRVLYVEGYPRWEYRYLKNLMQRERSIESSVMLLSADREFAQEGNTPIARLPRTREEFERFDLVVIGDMPAGFFSSEQLSEMRRAVDERGIGLVLIGGPRNMPRSWAGTAFEDLLPFTGPYELDRLPDPVNLRPTDVAARAGVLRLADDPKAAFPAELSSPDEEWARMEWAQRIVPSSLKPAAETLAESVQAIDGVPHPVVVSMRFGAGNVLYVGTDETWRWRNGRGEAYPERFWVQLLRAMARPSLGLGSEEVRVAVDPQRCTAGDAVRVEVELPPSDGRATVMLEASAESGGTVELEARRTESGTYEATLVAEQPGRWTIRPRDAELLARSGDGAVLEAVRDDAELRDAESDRPLLERLARETGGTVVDPAGTAGLMARLPNRSVVTEDPIRDDIRTSPAALILVMALLLAEWVLRRMSRLA
jgi:hypothetical protein